MQKTLALERGNLVTTIPIEILGLECALYCSKLFGLTLAEAIWLPTTGKKTVVATCDRLCKGDFLQIIWQILIFIPTAAELQQQGIGRITINR